MIRTYSPQDTLQDTLAPLLNTRVWHKEYPQIAQLWVGCLVQFESLTTLKVFFVLAKVRDTDMQPLSRLLEEVWSRAPS